MGNQQRIDDLVDLQAVESQLKTVQKLSADTTAEFVTLLKTTNELNGAISKVANNSQFTKAQQQAALAAEKLATAQAKTVAAQQRANELTLRAQALQEKQNAANKKAADIEAERNRIAEKRKRIVTENTAAEIAEANAARNGTAAIQQNTQALAANEATMRQNNLAEIQGEQAAARYRVARLGTTAATAEETAALAANTAAQTANSNAIAGIGRGLTRGLGYLRTLAYVLPGIGIAGIFNLIYDGLSKIFTQSPKFDKFLDDFKSLNELMMQAGAQSGAEIAKLDALFRAVSNANLPLKERNEAVKTLRDMYPEHLSNLTIDNAKTEALTGNYKALKEELINIAYVQAGYNKIAEATARIFDDEFRMNAERVNNIKIREKVNAAQKAENELNASGVRLRNANSDALDGNIRKTSQLAQAQGELAKSDKIIFDAAKDRAINEQRIALIQEQIDKRVKQSGVGVLGGDMDKEKKAKDTSAEDELRALEYQYNEQIALARAKDKENLELAEEYYKQIANFRKEAEANQLEDGKMASAYRLLELSKENQAILDALADRYTKGEISEKQYQQNKADLEYSYNQESIQENIRLATELIDIKKAYGKDTGNDELELARLQIKLSEQVTAKKISDIEKEAARRKELNAAIKNLAEEAAGFVIALVDAGFTNRKNALRAEQDQLEERTSQEIAAVDRSLLTEQQKADKIAVINAKAQADKERIARQQRAIDVEKAKFDKAVAIARIIENTAIGITSALAQFPPNVPLSILIGALGAVQLGTVLAQPIPQYAKGTKNAKGGLSIVGEQGRELIETPGGKSFLSPDTATMLNLPAGSKVTPHHETMRMIGRPENLSRYSGGEQVPWREVIAAIERNKPQKQTNKVNVTVDAGFYIYREQHFR